MWGVIVGGGVPHYHVEQGRPVMYSSRSEAESDFPRLKRFYLQDLHAREIKDGERIRASGVPESEAHFS